MPTLVGHGESTQFTTTTPKSLTGVAVQADDLLLVWQTAGDGLNSTFATAPSVSGTGTVGTWASTEGGTASSQSARGKLWRVDVTGSGSVDLSCVRSAGTSAWGCGWIVVRNHGGVGATNTLGTTSDQTGAQITLTGAVADSMLIYAGSDWDANTGVATWRTVDGVTPTIGNGAVLVETGDGSTYAARVAQWSSTTSAGSKNTGYSNLTVRPAGAAIEILVSPLVTQTARPDADTATTGWTSTPLFSKVNDQSDASVITGTLA